ncbi:hypothetical protein MUP77_15370 [Candidatus Bathyarchaeota archaeon]|nr:hypothetical protein [Candidatus Bathyarchaeota archaeon]
MSKKTHMNLKRKLLLEEHRRLLDEIGRIDVLLEGKLDSEETNALYEQVTKSFSFKESVDWLQPFIEHGLSGVEARLNEFADALENEFQGSSDLYELFQQNPDMLLERAKVNIILKLFMDGSLMLYAFGRYGAAIIELHGALERQEVERLAKLILLSERVDVGLKAIERHTLPDVTVMLRDCGILNKEDVKFAQKLNRLRNGLAHGNAKVVSDDLLSGRELLNADVESAVSDSDYIPLAIGTIHLLVKILEWYGETE